MLGWCSTVFRFSVYAFSVFGFLVFGFWFFVFRCPGLFALWPFGQLVICRGRLVFDFFGFWSLRVRKITTFYPDFPGYFKLLRSMNPFGLRKSPFPRMLGGVRLLRLRGGGKGRRQWPRTLISFRAFF